MYLIRYKLHNYAVCGFKYVPINPQMWLDLQKLTLRAQILKSIFLSVDENHTHALSKDTKHLRQDIQVCFYRRLFFDAVKPRGCIS